MWPFELLAASPTQKTVEMIFLCAILAAGCICGAELDVIAGGLVIVCGSCCVAVDVVVA